MNTIFSELFKNLKKLETLRNIHQFIFINEISPISMIEVRTKVLEFKQKNPNIQEIDFIIQSGGGSPADAYRIIRTLRNNFETVNIIIPFWAKSAATLLALGGNNIIMDEFGELGPLDIQISKEKDDSPQIERESALTDEFAVKKIEANAQELYHQMFIALYNSNEIKINKNELSEQLLNYLSKFYEPLLKQINPYGLGRKKRMLDIGGEYAKRILGFYNPNLQEYVREFLVDYLVNRCPDHGYVIDYNLISMFLPNVKKSSEIGTDYELCLQELVSFLLKNQNITYIGFSITNEGQQNNNNVVSNDNKITKSTLINSDHHKQTENETITKESTSNKAESTS